MCSQLLSFSIYILNERMSFVKVFSYQKKKNNNVIAALAFIRTQFLQSFTLAYNFRGICPVYTLIWKYESVTFQDSSLVTYTRISSALAFTLYLPLVRSKHWILAYNIQQTGVYASKLTVSCLPNFAQGRAMFLKSSKSPITRCYNYRE